VSEASQVSAARLEGTWARHAVAHAEALRSLDPSWGTTWFALADGWVVLQGPGLYVNRALAMGLVAEVTPTDLDVFEAAAARAGVPPTIDVVPATHSTLIDLLLSRSYEPTGSYGVMTMSLTASEPSADEPSADEPSADEAIEVRPITPDELGWWQQSCADGWGHDTPERRCASDSYAAAAAATAGETLLIAFDAFDGRPLGVASLAERDGVATLGGMSTLPAERGRGVQRALVAERLRLALTDGCDLAVCSAVSGGASERNVLRLGFVHRYVKSTWTRSTGS